METENVVKVARRTEKGTANAKRLRRGGSLPAVVYGHELKTESISVEKDLFEKLLHDGSRTFRIELDGKVEQVLLKALQYNVMGDHIIHVDFIRVAEGEKIKINVLIELIGTPIGTKADGKLEHLLKGVEVECLPMAIPKGFALNVMKLDVGEALRVKDIELPEGVEIVNDAEDIVAQVVVIIEETEEDDEGKSFDMPEVIGAKDPEEDKEEEK